MFVCLFLKTILWIYLGNTKLSSLLQMLSIVYVAKVPSLKVHRTKTPNTQFALYVSSRPSSQASPPLPPSPFNQAINWLQQSWTTNQTCLCLRSCRCSGATDPPQWYLKVNPDRVDPPVCSMDWPSLWGPPQVMAVSYVTSGHRLGDPNSKGKGKRWLVSLKSANRAKKVSKVDDWS